MALTAGASRAGPLPVHSAAGFVDSVGVNAHLASEPYTSRFGQVREALRRLGIRHVRDELRPGNDLGRWRSLHESLGVRSHLLVSPATNTVPQMLDYLQRLGAHRVSGIEGQNEGDSGWFRAQPSAGSDWAASVVAYQRAVFQALRRHHPGMPVLSPSVLDYRPDDMARLRPAAPFCDAVAIHPYAQHNQPPETTDDYAALEWYLRTMRDPFKPGAPVMATEAGYRTMPNAATQAEAATWLPRLLLHNFAAGVRRTFLYELMDGGTDPADGEDHWGLLHHDGTPKLAFAAVAALVTAMRGVGSGGGTPPVTAATPQGSRCLMFAGAGGAALVAVWSTGIGSAGEVMVRGDASRRAATMALGGATWSPLADQSGAWSVPAEPVVRLLRLLPA